MRLTLWISGCLLLLMAAAPLLLYAGIRWYYEPGLPSLDALRDLQLEVPLRVYTRDGKLIGEFGAERRAPMSFDRIPPRIVDAFIAAEDDRFFEHPGVDWQGLLRAAIKLALTGEKTQGGSTITMQLARNVLLTPERSYERKIREILLALRIEREMSKQQILETYLNKIFLGQRAYGVGAASQIYFGIQPAQLSWAQAALLAGLPKAPSRDNPVAAPERAQQRRDYVLRRLRDLGKLSELEFQAALAESLIIPQAAPPLAVDAQYVAEMARAEMFSRFGEAAYTSGFQVTTTVDSVRQEAANRALRSALLAYDERHGWRGAEARVPADLLIAGRTRQAGIDALLSQRPVAAGLRTGVVVSFTPETLSMLLNGHQRVEVAAADFKWAGLSPQKALLPGDIVRVRALEDRWRLAQVPEAQGALVALDPRDGAIEAVTGGYDFLLNKYNRATQARRQAGSGFKPFLYAAAFDAGMTPATVLLDAPVVYRDSELEGAWRPENYDGDFKGPMRLRDALVHSRNLVSIRVLQQVGLDRTRNYVARFGLPLERMPRDLSIALGTASYTPLELAGGYAVLANGGFRVEPYLIRTIVDGQGREVFSAQPGSACDPCAPTLVAGASSAETRSDAAASSAPVQSAPRVVDARVAWLVDDVLREVVIRGTGAGARKLGRADIAGKTGTSNDETDAWFNGFNGELVAVTWMGFDQPAPLGRGEVGGRAALPMWMDFMREALKDRAEVPRPRPPGLVNVRINRGSGLLAVAGDPNALVEIVPADRVPEADYGDGHDAAAATGVEELF